MLDVAIRRWAGIGDQQISDERHYYTPRRQQPTQIPSLLSIDSFSILMVSCSEDLLNVLETIRSVNCLLFKVIDANGN